jgi:hypothetical protein
VPASAPVKMRTLDADGHTGGCTSAARRDRFTVGGVGHGAGGRRASCPKGR